MFKKVSNCIHWVFDSFFNWLCFRLDHRLVGLVSLVKVCACLIVLSNVLAAFSSLDTIKRYPDPEESVTVDSNWDAKASIYPHFYPGQDQPTLINSFPVQGARGYQGDALWFQAPVKRTDLADIKSEDENKRGAVYRTVLLYTIAAPGHECSSWRQIDSHGYDRSCAHRFLVRKVGPPDWTPSKEDITFPDSQSKDHRIVAEDLISLRVMSFEEGKPYITLNQKSTVDTSRPRGFVGGHCSTMYIIDKATSLTTSP